MLARVVSTVEARNYEAFKLGFGITNDLVAGDGLTDQDLIEMALSRMNGSYLVTYIEDNEGGYYRIFRFA